MTALFNFGNLRNSVLNIGICGTVVMFIILIVYIVIFLMFFLISCVGR